MHANVSKSRDWLAGGGGGQGLGFVWGRADRWHRFLSHSPFVKVYGGTGSQLGMPRTRAPP